ncbi:hypothetical protein F966_01308 [Acinetobacter higginsii]|uniref:Uncharacterized protein n=1 Tax=Acinetobacter higginsii TaxID=70347 RepID=N8WE22_9GAMM|nr:hypothetical protein F966_01308 [Acinetobacter higginsii]
MLIVGKLNILSTLLTKKPSSNSIKNNKKYIIFSALYF